MTPVASFPYLDPNQPSSIRVADLLERMSVEEKVAQMCVAPMDGLMVDRSGVLSVAPEIGERIRFGFGAFRNICTRRSAEEASIFHNAVQSYIGHNTRHGIPVLMFEEGLHGLLAPDATVFPQAIALASSWNTDLLEGVFRVVALEGRSRGVHQIKGPVLDIATDPRWGRVEETYGEDPVLVSRMGLAVVRGLQGRQGELDSSEHVACMLKHFAGYGQSNGGRNFAPSPLPERELRDLAIFPFRVCITEGGARGIMPSHNEIDGVPTHSSEWMLTRVLRDEMGFEGVVLSDYDDVRRLSVFHRTSDNEMHAAVAGATAGVDIEQPPNVYPYLVDAVKANMISENVIDRAVGRVLKLKFDLGLFENRLCDPKRGPGVARSPNHLTVSRNAAEECAVLLQNENHILPLRSDAVKRLAVIGPNADEIHHGGYSVRPHRGISVLEGFRKKLDGNVEVVFAKGCRITVPVDKTYEREGDSADDGPFLADEVDNRTLIREAMDVAVTADAVILVLGGNEETATEAGYPERFVGDRDSLDLIGQQDELVGAIVATGKPIIAILIGGRPLSVVSLVDSVPAVIQAWYLGEFTGAVLADIVFGDVVPSGKLPVTIPRSVGQVPLTYRHKPSAHHKKYLFADSTPLFHFGHGLSYTQFTYSELSLSSNVMQMDGSIRATIRITNSGTVRGKEVVQLYVRDHYGSVTRPTLELKDFEKVELDPNESREVTFVIDVNTLSFTRRDMTYGPEPGAFTAMVGGDSHWLKCEEFSLV
jgi:beta-glucosidase